jgi:hypothetical protein
MSSRAPFTSKEHVERARDVLLRPRNDQPSVFQRKNQLAMDNGHQILPRLRGRVLTRADDTSVKFALTRWRKLFEDAHQNGAGTMILIEWKSALVMRVSSHVRRAGIRVHLATCVCGSTEQPGDRKNRRRYREQCSKKARDGLCCSVQKREHWPRSPMQSQCDLHRRVRSNTNCKKTRVLPDRGKRVRPCDTDSFASAFAKLVKSCRYLTTGWRMVFDRLGVVGSIVQRIAHHRITHMPSLFPHRLDRRDERGFRQRGPLVDVWVGLWVASWKIRKAICVQRRFGDTPPPPFALSGFGWQAILVPRGAGAASALHQAGDVFLFGCSAPSRQHQCRGCAPEITRCPATVKRAATMAGARLSHELDMGLDGPTP